MMTPNKTPEMTAKRDLNRGVENQPRYARRPVYHETMMVYTESSRPGHFDNSAGILGGTGKMENTSLGISRKIESVSLGVSHKMESVGLGVGQKMETASLGGQKSGGSETELKGVKVSLGSPISDFKDEMESSLSSSTISHTENVLSTPSTHNLHSKGEDDEEEAFELERLKFNLRKFAASYKSSDWPKVETYISAILTMIASNPKLEFHLKASGNKKDKLLRIMLMCQSTQNKWKGVLKTIDIVLEGARTEQDSTDDLQALNGTLENLRAHAYKELGELESARLACKKAVRIRRGDPRKLNKSIDLMLRILEEMGAEHDVEAEFYKSLISRDTPLVEVPKQDSRHGQEKKPQRKLEAIDSPDIDKLLRRNFEAENQAQTGPVPTADIMPRLITAPMPTSSQTSLHPSGEALEHPEKYDELYMPDYYEERAEEVIGGLRAGHLERLRTEDPKYLEQYGLKVSTDNLKRKRIVPIGANGKDSALSFSDSTLIELMRKIIVEEENLELFESLLKYHRLHILNLEMDFTWFNNFADRGSLLHYAALHNKLDMVGLLIQYGADMKALTKKGYSVLHIVSVQQSVELKMMEFLIGNGAPTTGPVVQNNPQKNSVLHLTILRLRDSSEDPAKLCLLLKSGVQVDARNEQGLTPLLMAIHYSTASVTRILLEAGASVTATNNSGDTALHLAARYFGAQAHGTASVFSDRKLKVELLLEYRADRNAKNNGGKRPIDYVVHPVALETLGRRLKPDPWYRF